MERLARGDPRGRVRVKSLRSMLDTRVETPFFPRFSLIRARSRAANPYLKPYQIFMALKIRLQRHGASHRPFYRMVVTEATARRDGRFVEVLGTYEPQATGKSVELRVNLERVDYWKSVGAKPTDTAASLIRKARREAPVEA